MSQLAVDTYEHLLRQSGLIRAEQLTDFMAQLRARLPGQPLDAQLLAKYLIKAKLLTPWQHSQLMRGITKGFFIGKYKLHSRLGVGGMSQVYLGEHIMMKRLVAIKILDPALCESSSYLTRFYRESQATAALDHHNIVKAYDVGCEGKTHFLVMEYVEGVTFQQLVEKDGPLPYDKALEYLRQAADALECAHQNGIIHRDIKPGNLMLNTKNVVKLLDLGMVRLTQDEMTSITIRHNESMLGTADYLSPEQALDSHHVDHRTDIYSLGCTFYFYLTGQPPFNDGTMALRLMKHQTEEPTALNLKRPDIPDAVVRICKKMMAKRPEDRYQSSADISRVAQAALTAPGQEIVGAEPALRDTVTQSGGRTVMTTGSADRVKVHCNGCNADFQAPNNMAGREIPCPMCAQPVAVPALPLSPDVRETQAWKYADFEEALKSCKPIVGPAVRHLAQRFPGNEKVVAVLLRLLNKAGELENAGNGKWRVEKETLKALIEELGAIVADTPTQALQRIILGQVFTGNSDPIATELAIQAFFDHPTPTREKFVVNLLAGAELARPEGRGQYTASELRVKVSSLFYGKPVSDLSRQELQAKLNSRSLKHEARALIQRVLNQ